MSFLKQTKSKEVINGGYNLFSLPPTDVSNLGVEYEKVFCENFDGTDTNRSIDFHVAGNNDSFIELIDSYLLLTLSIKKPDGSNLADGENICLISDPSGIFRAIEVFLSDTLISSIQGLYNYRSFIENVLNYNSRTAQNQLDLLGIHWDNHADTFAGDTGIQVRKRQYAGSAKKQVVMKIHSDLFNQPKYLVPRCNLKLRLHRSADAFCLLASDNATAYKLHIDSIYLFIKRIKPSPSLQVSLLEARQKENVVYNFNRVKLYSHLLTPGASSYNIPLQTENILPNFCIVVFVKNNINYADNPFKCDHLGIKNIHLLANNTKYPRHPFEPDFAGGHVARELFALYQLRGEEFANSSLTISLSKYIKGYTLFAFKLSNCQGNEVSLIQSGNLRLCLDLNANLTTAYNAIIYMSSTDSIEIDQYGNVLISHV